MSARIKLRSHQIADLASIRDVGASRLGEILKVLQSQEKPPLRPEQLKHTIQSIVDDANVAEALMRPLLSLYGLVHQTSFSVSEVIEGLRAGLHPSVSEWSDSEFAKWDAVEPCVVDLLNSKAVRTVAKVADLSYEYANLFQNARIISDIRPIFNDDTSESLEIEGAVVSFTMRLNYDSRDGEHSLSLAMDQRDIEELQKQCLRALSKADTIQEQMSRVGQIPSVVSGADDNSS